jgi:hypothetical protein
MSGSTPISAADAINPALQHAKQQLLEPLRFSQWWRLAFVGGLAGEMSSGGGCNSSFKLPPMHHPSAEEHFLNAGLPPLLPHNSAMLLALLPFLVVLGFALLVLFLYISSVMRFMLFDSIITRECHIRQGWARRKHHGLRLFLFQLVLMLLTFAAFFLLIGIPLACAWTLGWFKNPREYVVQLVLGGVCLLSLVLALAVLSAVVHVMTKDFVVPQMALEDISAVEGWRRLWSSLKAEKLGYLGYIGMKIVLAIGASLVLGIVAVLVLLVLLLPVGGLGVAAVLAAKTAGLTWNFQTIMLAAAAGSIVLAVFLFVMSLISVPATVFFPAYSIYFFAPRYSPLASLLWPQTSPAIAPAIPPPDPPLSPA